MTDQQIEAMVEKAREEGYEKGRKQGYERLLAPKPTMRSLLKSLSRGFKMAAPQLSRVTIAPTLALKLSGTVTKQVGMRAIRKVLTRAGQMA
jgi:hypothetical protein